MCLAVPGELISINEGIDPLFKTGIVSFGGVRKEVNLRLLPEAQEAQYLMVHVGVALSIIDEHEARETAKHLKAMGEWPSEEQLNPKS